MTAHGDSRKSRTAPVDYDRISTSYDFGRQAGKSESRLLAKLLGPLANSCVLDAGCGTANYLLKLKDLSRLRVGLDLSEGMLGQARSKNVSALFVRGHAVYMPFSDLSFDAAYCIQVLHHIQEKSTFMSEVYRILRPGGRFVIQSCSHEQLTTFCCYHYFKRALEVDRMRIPDLDEISGLLSDTGFTDISIHGCSVDDAFEDAPDSYLDKRVRDGVSTFGLLAEEDIQEGCESIKRDVQSGVVSYVVEERRRKLDEIGSQASFIRAVKS